MKYIMMMILIALASNLNAINVTKLPRTIIQPDGTKIECFITGDEFGGMIHDADGYALIKNKEDGWWYYATKDNNENPVCSKYIAGHVNPQEKGLKKGIYKFNKEFYDDVSKHRKENIGKFSVSGGVLKSATLTTSGFTQINSLVIFIRFNGSSEFYQNRDYYSTFFNSTTTPSLKDYFLEASYNQLNVNSTFYPLCASSTNLSYVDIYNRSYYVNDDYEVGGYSDDQRTEREHSLLKRAVEAIASQVPANINIDTNNDGLVDDVCFIVQGGIPDVYHGDLLWPHHWALYSYNVSINGKRVYNYTLLNHALQFSAETICHEFFHGLGAPDFYRSSNNNPSFEPTGYWGLMGNSHENFSHMDAYSKNRYGGWIASIPEITQTGTYSLSPITSSSNNCYKIKSPYVCDEYFILEYRKRSGKYENTLEGDGLLVYRINPNGDNYYGPYDEAYIYRPGGTLTINGTPASANYSSQVGRTSISDVTTPSSFLKSGTAGGLKISNVGSSGTTISFTCEFPFSISGSSSICTSGSTYSITNPGGTVEWSATSTNNNLSINPSTGEAYVTNSTPGEGTISAIIHTTECGDKAVPPKRVWVGQVDPARIVSSREGQAVGAWAQYHILCKSGTTLAAAGYDSDGDGEPMGDSGYPSSQSITGYQWSFPSGWSYSSTGVGKQNEHISISCSTYPPLGQMVQVGVRAQNDCGWTNWKYDYWQVVSCSGGILLKISPNPTESEATLALESEDVDVIDKNLEWEYEIYSPRLLLKEKKTKLKERNTKINTSGWKDGVYIVKARVGNEVLSEKLVVKH